MIQRHSTMLSVAAALTLVMAGCGAVITPQPTAMPVAQEAPAHTPTPLLRTTATAPVLPPAATATPTVSPTPIVHVVQSGDTLLDIAQEYGVGLDRLQTANNIDDPTLLRVGQELMIPVGEEEETSGGNLLLPTPTPQSFGLRGLAFHETPVGSLWCMGEAVNTSDVLLTNVQVQVTLFDAEGLKVAEADTFAIADLIPPGERSPFGILFTNPLADWATPQMTIVRGEAAGELGAAYVPLATTDVSGESVASRFRIGGTASNANADVPVQTVAVIATAYDAEGRVIGFRQKALEPETALAPGGSLSFEILFDVHGDAAPDDFHVLAVGRIAPQ